jgi:hypothetical protein
LPHPADTRIRAIIARRMNPNLNTSYPKTAVDALHL